MFDEEGKKDEEKTKAVQAQYQNANFEPISVDDKLNKILHILYNSLVNLRELTQNIDLT